MHHITAAHTCVSNLHLGFPRQTEEFSDAETWWGQVLISQYYGFGMFMMVCAHAPTTRSGRFLQLALGVFFLIVLATYTANLAAYLSVGATATPTVDDLQDLKDKGMTVNRRAVTSAGA